MLNFMLCVYTGVVFVFGVWCGEKYGTVTNMVKVGWGKLKRTVDSITD